MEILSFPSLSERGPFLGSGASFLKKGGGVRGEGRMERGVGKVRKALTLLIDGKLGSPFLSSQPLPPVLVHERVNARILFRSNL